MRDRSGTPSEETPTAAPPRRARRRAGAPSLPRSSPAPSSLRGPPGARPAPAASTPPPALLLLLHALPPRGAAPPAASQPPIVLPTALPDTSATPRASRPSSAASVPPSAEEAQPGPPPSEPEAAAAGAGARTGAERAGRRPARAGARPRPGPELSEAEAATPGEPEAPPAGEVEAPEGAPEPEAPSPPPAPPPARVESRRSSQHADGSRRSSLHASESRRSSTHSVVPPLQLPAISFSEPANSNPFAFLDALPPPGELPLPTLDMGTGLGIGIAFPGLATPTLSPSPSANLNMDIAGLTVVTTPAVAPTSFRFDLNFNPGELTVAVREPGPLPSMAPTPIALSPHISIISGRSGRSRAARRESLRVTEREREEASQTEANLTIAAMNALQLTGELHKFLEGEGDYEIDDAIAAQTARNLEQAQAAGAQAGAAAAAATGPAPAPVPRAPRRRRAPTRPARAAAAAVSRALLRDAHAHPITFPGVRILPCVRILNMADGETDGEGEGERAAAAPAPEEDGAEADEEGGEKGGDERPSRPPSLGRARTVGPGIGLAASGAGDAPTPPKGDKAISSKSTGWLTAPQQTQRPPSMDQLGGAMRQSVVMRALERQATKQQERRRVTKNVSFGRKGSQVEYEDDTMGAGAGSGRWWGSNASSADGEEGTGSETEHVGDAGAPPPDAPTPEEAAGRALAGGSEDGGNTTRRMRKTHIAFREEDDVFVFNKSGTQSGVSASAPVSAAPSESEGEGGGESRPRNRRNSAEEIQEKTDQMRRVPLHKQRSFRSSSFNVLSNISYEEIDVDDMEVKERMGIGSFAEVFRAQWQGREVAVKRYLSEIHKATKEEVATFRQEASIMSRLEHANVIRLLGACTKPPHMALVMEFCKGGSLEKRLKEHWMDRQLPRPIMYKIARDIAKGMAYLHGFEPPVVHRDLKAANILLRESSVDSWDVAIGDFGGEAGLSPDRARRAPAGLSIDCDKSRFMTECGTLQYIAPEVLRSDPSNEKVDVYGYAMLLYEVIFRRVPYADMPVPPLMACMRAVYEGLRPTTEGCPYPELLPLLDACWADEPKDRPEFHQIVEALDELEAQAAASGAL
eukprot:tig00020904_g15176.t1